MKKIYSFLFAAASLLAVSSCQEEIVDPNPEILDTPVVKITASGGAETKTVLLRYLKMSQNMMMYGIGGIHQEHLHRMCQCT